MLVKEEEENQCSICSLQSLVFLLIANASSFYILLF